MAFFNSAVGVPQTLVVALGAGLGIWQSIFWKVTATMEQLHAAIARFPDKLPER